MRIVILTREKNDPVIANLSLWLQKLDANVTIVYRDDLYNNYDITVEKTISDFHFTAQSESNEIIDSNEVEVFFLRQEITYNYYGDCSKERFKVNEYNACMEYICYELNQKGKLIGYCPPSSKNKLIQLSYARSCGLKVPRTIVSNSSQSISENFVERVIVNKAIQEVYISKNKNGFTTNYTQQIKIDDIPAKFDLALFQTKVNKDVELRVFVFGKDVYSVAAYSLDMNTEIDIRILMAKRAVEYYAYEIPIEIRNKLIKLTDELKLDMCSFDIIVSANRGFYVIDINPFGQISMIAQTCFMQLEEEMATKIINYAKEKKFIC